MLCGRIHPELNKKEIRLKFECMLESKIWNEFVSTRSYIDIIGPGSNAFYQSWYEGTWQIETEALAVADVWLLENELLLEPWKVTRELPTLSLYAGPGVQVEAVAVHGKEKFAHAHLGLGNPNLEQHKMKERSR